MKRIVTSFLVLVMLLSSLTLTAFAAGTSINMSGASGKPGDIVTVDISISGNTGFTAYGMYVTYDSNVLELTALTKSALSDGFFEGNIKNGKVGFASSETITGNGVLFTATFKIKATAADSQYNVGISLDSIGISSSNTMSPSVSGNKITVSTPHECTLKDVSEVPATCTTPGVKAHKKCDGCGKLYLNGKVVDAESLKTYKDHDWEWIIDKAATATSTGLKHEECSSCHATRNNNTVIPQVAHDHKWEWIIDKPATETSTGLKHEECSVCHATRNENTVVPQLTHKHTMTHHPAIAATCCETGTIEHWTCDHEACKGIYYGNEDGTEILNSVTLDKDPNNHSGDITIENAKEATDKEAGYTGDKVCSDCKSIVEKGSEIPVMGTPSDDDGCDLWWLWILILIAIVVVIFLFIYFRRKKKQEEEEQSVQTNGEGV